MADLSLVPESPRELGIDKDAWWDGQRETVAEIIEAFQTKKYVMAAVPTGGGKTVIAAAVQKLLASRGFSRGSVALTHTIQLQKQYQQTLKDAKVITGRSNWACELPSDSEYRIGAPNLNAEQAPCTEGACPIGLKGRGGCAYYQQWWEAADAPMVVMNYALAAKILPVKEFKEYPTAPKGTPNPFRRSLLVMDECHLAHDSIVEAATTEIWRGPVQAELGIDFPALNTRMAVNENGKTKLYESTAVWAKWAEKALPKIEEKVDEIREEQQRQRERLREEGRTPSVLAGLNLANLRARRLRTMKTSFKALAGLNTHEKVQAWTVTRNASSVVIQPLWGWDHSVNMMFQHFERVLLMSATPGDPALARIKLGIEKEDFVYIERPSTFPVQNRPVMIIPIVKLSYTSPESDWELMAKAIIQISEKFPNRKGIVHSGSAANAKKLVEIIDRLSPNGSRFYTHGAGQKFTRETALEEFITTRLPRVLVTASYTTGVDLPYLIGWQVIAKIPFPSLADDIVARRRAYTFPNGYRFGQEVYKADTMNTVIQAAGRINRSPTDSGPTYILDANYGLLVDAYRPRFYNEAVIRLTLEST